ncbi:hypothetical protein ACFL5M_01385 [Candidatus Neomarinimicrobiota bacterium]
MTPIAYEIVGKKQYEVPIRTATPIHEEPAPTESTNKTTSSNLTLEDIGTGGTAVSLLGLVLFPDDSELWEGLFWSSLGLAVIGVIFGI